MNHLTRYLKPYWKMATLAPLFMLIEVSTDLIQPLLMAKIIDTGIINGNLSYILKTGLLMIGVALLGSLGGIGCVFFASKTSQSFGADLRLDVFRKIQSFSFDSLDHFGTPSLITRLTNDVTQVQFIVLALLRMLVRAPLLFTGGIVMAFIINPGLALILVVVLPILIVVITFIIKKAFPLFALVQRKLDKLNAVMRENLSGIRVVKAFVRSDYENKRFAAANSDLQSVMIKASQTMGATMPVMMLLMNLSIVAIVWFGGVRVNYGTMQVGQVMAFINYMLQILFSLMMLAFMLVMASRAKASADRIIELLKTAGQETLHKEAPESATSQNTPLSTKHLPKGIRKGHFEFQNVFFHYQGAGGDPVLKNISFTASPGETLAILGATGAGKSTLVHLIPRFYEPTAGSILIDGQDIRHYSLQSLRAMMSIVLQESILFSGSIMENILWGSATATEAEVINAAKVAQAHEFISAFPQGYQMMIGQKGVNLSGGQKQRIAIARALLKAPTLLIFDDSTSAVDMGTEARIRSALKKQLKDTTCLLIAQRISSVIDADKILLLEGGEIAALGTHQELLKNSLLYQDIYQSQIGEEVI